MADRAPSPPDTDDTVTSSSSDATPVSSTTSSTTITGDTGVSSTMTNEAPRFAYKIELVGARARAELAKSGHMDG